ncbi:hypothetical protein NQ314_010157 [Rhamnusium bicolor]|uniref:Cytochrome c oxidase subunit n=1 Tax=Rhamnusium bicolor TaxID=1586634 RepID=A0AAV8XSQ8_9CUCU|nr:hypothetical protein NQ314_010157 [Rhamnusium bicolor]
MSGLFSNLALRSIHPPYPFRQRSKNACPPPGQTHIPKEGGYKIYMFLTFFLGFPAIGAAATNVYLEKSKKEECRPPFVKYEYLRLRSKRFPWGDGSRSLFHNPKVNALPDGYEDDEQ